MKNTPDVNDEGLTMLPQQQQKNQEAAQAPWRQRSTVGDDKRNSSNRTDMQGRTLQPEGQVLLKNGKPHSLRKANKETRRRRQRYLKRSKRAAKSKWEHAMGQKGEHHQVPSIHSQEKKKKAAKNGNRNAPFRQQPVEDTTKRTPIAANCLEKAVKRKPQAEERKAEQKTSPKSPQTHHKLRHGRDKVLQHQQKVPGSGQPANHQRLPRNEETPSSVWTTCRGKNEAEQLTAQTKTEERTFPEPREESTDPNAGLKTEKPRSRRNKEGKKPPSQSKKTKRNLEGRQKNVKQEDKKNGTCELHQNQVDAGKPQEIRKRRSD